MFFSRSSNDPFPHRFHRYCTSSYDSTCVRRLQRAQGCLGASGDPGGIGGVLEEPHVGDRADTSRNRRERLSPSRDPEEIQVTHETLFAGPGVSHRIYFYVYGNNPLADVFFL